MENGYYDKIIEYNFYNDTGIIIEISSYEHQSIEAYEVTLNTSETIVIEPTYIYSSNELTDINLD